jgi:hypothetical protein
MSRQRLIIKVSSEKGMLENLLVAIQTQLETSLNQGTTTKPKGNI